MIKDISARTTLGAKVIFPLLWLTLVGAIVILGFRDTSNSNAFNARWALLFFWLGGLLCFCFFSFPLKSVKLDDHHLHVSNYRKKILIPLSNVEGLSQMGRFVTITLKSPSEFGKEIRFMTRFDYRTDIFTLGFGEHPVVKQLKQRAGIRES